MNILDGVKLNYDDVLLIPKRSNLKTRNFQIKRRFTKFKHYNGTLTTVPIIAANMDHTGTWEMAKVMQHNDCMTALSKFVPLSEFTSLRTAPLASLQPDSSWIWDYSKLWYTIGMNGDDPLPMLPTTAHLCIDVANGYTEKFVEFVSRIRDNYPNTLIMAGNVATPNQTEALLIAGADIVKIGIGPGSVCTTRKMTGVGYPQLSAIIECADVAHGIGGMICADGGCTVPGDVCKAFAAGADFVMLGGMLAGHKQCSGTYIFPDGSEYDTRDGYHESVKKTTAAFHPNEEHVVKDMHVWLSGLVEPTGMKFYGMSSKEAQEKYYGGVSDYKAAEGKEVIVPYRGDADETIKEILGGIRSCMTYIGASRLKDIPKCATFARTTSQLNNIYS